MSSPPITSTDNINNLLTVDEEYAAPRIVAANALQQDFGREYQRSIADADGFWAHQAHCFQWDQPWKRVMDGNGARHQWFVGGKLNITVNALDRHANGERKNKVAYIWLGEDGTERARHSATPVNENMLT